jgi:hypothetical protein
VGTRATPWGVGTAWRRTCPPWTAAGPEASGASGTTLEGSMSTRRLILAALLCGLAILVAFTVQVAILL